MNLIEFRRIRCAMGPIDYGVWMSLRVTAVCWPDWTRAARVMLTCEGRGWAVTGAGRTRLSAFDTSHHWRNH